MEQSSNNALPNIEQAILSVALAIAGKGLGQLSTGVILDYAGASAPTGWLLCDGSAVSRATYSDLFATIGVAFGAGDGSTTFNIPDLRGRVTVGKDDMGGTTASRMTTGGSGLNGTTLGASGGLETHTLTTPQMPAHVHPYDASSADTSTPGSARPMAKDLTVDRFPSTNSTGGGGAHNNTQPSTIVNKIIKV